MQFISKFNNRKKGHHIVKCFIKGCWDRDINQYSNLNYEELKRCKKFRYLLLKEQQGFCCYCMREISRNELTLEHVMPHHIGKNKQKEEFKYYKQYGQIKRVYYCSDIPSSPKLRIPPYPHSIAYENLVASCNGKLYKDGKKNHLHQCCNNYRGNNKIIPLFFLPRIADIIQYETDGTLTYCERFDSSVKLLNLNHSTLIFIRKIWARIVLHNIKINQIKAAIKDDNLRIDIIDDIDIELPERNTLKIDLYWNLLLEFYWFYNYFTIKLHA